MAEEATSKASPKGDVSNEKGLPELSVDELLSKLVKGSPKAHITLAGVQTTCTLDTGAETSLIKASFYRKHLVRKLKEVQSLGTYLQSLWGRRSRNSN